MEAAITLVPPLPTEASTSEWIGRRMKAYRKHCHLIYSTVASQYFPPDKKQRVTDII